ncbi:hypothetical protein LL033_05370 [Clostridium estertheticum]|uniref:hypothetical protein n=1 Tax=Clostridium estertheticum TaxID=238834 RepID=UPI00227C397B|nr:hypothetical protein [Clostridium estertheticum]WAG56672.1 hypothetical protein LL033_05370 [Clostridium estertheticum]
MPSISLDVGGSRLKMLIYSNVVKRIDLLSDVEPTKAFILSIYLNDASYENCSMSETNF